MANEEIYARIGRADQVFVNGEGTIHGSGRACINLLYMAYVAHQYMRKKVYVVNHSVYPEHGQVLRNTAIKNFYAGVYAAFDYVAIRETVSKSMMDSLGVRSVLSFDCLPYYIAQKFKPVQDRSRTVVVAGSVAFQRAAAASLAKFMGKMSEKGCELVVLTGAKQYPAADDQRFVESLAGMLEGRWRHVQARSLEQWIETIGAASLLVSGRFHHTLAAFALRTPFVMLASNTNKMAGLQQMLNAPKPLDYDRPDLYEALLAGASHADSKEYSDTVFNSDRLRTFTEMALRNVPSGVATAPGDQGFGGPHEDPTLAE